MSATSPTLTLEVQADYNSLAALQATLRDIQKLSGGANLAGTGDPYQTQKGALLELKKEVSTGLSAILTMHEQSNEKILVSSKRNASALARVAEHGSDLMVATRLKAQEQLDTINAEALAKDWAYGNKRVELAASMNMLKLTTERQMQEKSADQAAAMNLLKLTEERAMQQKSVAQAEALNMLKLTTERDMQEKSVAQAKAMNLLKLTEERSMAQAHAANLISMAEKDIAYGQMSLARQIALRRDIAAAQGHANLGQAYVQNKFAPAAIADTRPIAQMEAALKAQGVAAHGAADGHNKLNGMMREGHSLARGMAGPLGAMWLTWGSILPLLTGAAVASAIKGIVTNGKELQYQLTFVTALTNGATISTEEFSTAMRGAQVSTREGAEGLRALAQAGLSAKEALQALPDVLRLATVGELSVSAAALGVTGVLHAFNLEISDTGRVVDVFSKAAALSNTSVSSMVASMQQASVVGDMYNVTLEEMAATLAVLAKRNIVGTSAGTAVKNMISEMVAPTEKASEAMKRLGLNFYDSSNRLKPYTQMLSDLKLKIDGLDEKSKIVNLSAMFGERGVKGASGLLANLDLYLKTLDTLKNKTEGFAKSVTDLLGGTVEGQLKRAANELSLAYDAAFRRTEAGWSNLTLKLSETIRSEGFREFLDIVSNGLLKLTTLVADHGGKILALVAAYAALKRVSLTLGLMETAAAAAKAATSVTSIVTATQAATAASVALRGILASILWPVAIVTALGAAYFYLAKGINNAGLAEENRELKSRNLIKRLDDETAAVKEKTKALRIQALTGVSPEEAQTQTLLNEAKKTLEASKSSNKIKASKEVDEGYNQNIGKEALGRLKATIEAGYNRTAESLYAQSMTSFSATKAAHAEDRFYTDSIDAQSAAKDLEKSLEDKVKAKVKGAAKLLSDLRRDLAEPLKGTKAEGILEVTKSYEDQASKLGANNMPATKDGNIAASDAQRAADKLASAYDRIKEKGSDRIRMQKEELAQGEKLSMAQKDSAEILDFIADAKGKLLPVEAAYLRQQSAEILSNDGLTKQAAQALKDKEDLTLAQARYTDSLTKTLEASYATAQSEQDRVDGLQRQIDVFGLSEQAITALEARKLNDAAATYTQQAAEMAHNGTAQETVNWVYAQIDAIKLRAKALENFGVKTTELDALKEAKKFTEDFVKSTSDGFRKIYDSITTGGGNVFKNLKQSAKALFFDWLYNLTLKDWVIRVSTSISSGSSGSLLSSALGQVTGGSGAAAGASGGGASGSLSSLVSAGQSVYSAFSGALSANVGRLVSTFAPKLGSAIAGQMLGSAAGLGPTIAGSATGIGSLTSGVGALGSAISTALPYLALAVAAFSVFKSVFGKKKIPRFSTERASDYQNGVFNARIAGQTYKPLGAEVALDGLSEQFSRSLGSFLKGFGLNDSVSTTASLFKKRKASYGNFTATFDGGSVTAGTKGKAKNVQDTADRLNAVVLGSSLAEAIQKTNAVQGIKDLFKGLKEKTQVSNMISATIGLNEVQAELAEKYALNTDLAGKVSLASGEAGDALAGFVNKLSAVGLASRTLGGQIVKNTSKLLADFNTVFGDVVTEAVLSTVSRQVEVPAAVTQKNGYFGSNQFSGGAFGNPIWGSSTFDFSKQGMGDIKQFQTVTEQVTTFITRIASKNLALPKTLADYDTLLKNIDKTTLAGQKMFADVFALRDQFVAKINTENGLKGNLRSGLGSIVSDAEKQKLLEEDLSTIFGELKLSVPATLQDLIKMGQGALAQLNAGTATEATYNLASAFPSLISAFKATKEGVENLIKSLREENDFKTLYDYNFYKGLADNYGNEFANKYIDGASVNYGTSNNTSVALPSTVPFSNNTTVSSSDPNMLNAMTTLIDRVNALQSTIAKIETNTAAAAQTLKNVTPNGDAIQTELAK